MGVLLDTRGLLPSPLKVYPWHYPWHQLPAFVRSLPLASPSPPPRLAPPPPYPTPSDLEVHHTIAELMILANVEVAMAIQRAFPTQVRPFRPPAKRLPSRGAGLARS